MFFVCFFLLEAILSIWTGMQYDMNIWFDTGKWMQQGINIYMQPDHVGYPPLWPVWCDIVYRIYAFSKNNLDLWRFTIKLPLILAHLALAFAVGEYSANRFDHKIAQRVFLIALSSSFFIFIGAMWGQINTLSTLLTFLAFYTLVRERTSLSAVLLGIAVTLKVYPLIVLPAFLAYVFRKKNKKEMTKLALVTIAIPIIYTIIFFTIYQWDMAYLFQTLFYWSPVYTKNPVQIQGGGMNIWSFTSLLNLDISQVGFLRLIWIPVLAIIALFWFRESQLNDEKLCLSIVSFYVLFMITYAWIPEQMFLDPLPFVFLLIFAYQPKKFYLYLLILIQALVYAFSAMNWGIFIFNPFLERFYPNVLTSISFFNPTNNYIWTAREILGLLVSLALGAFLLTLLKPSIIESKKKWKIKVTS